MFDHTLLPATLEDGAVHLRRLDFDRDIEELFYLLPQQVWEHLRYTMPSDPAGLAADLWSRIQTDGRTTWAIESAGNLVGTTSHIPVRHSGGLEIGSTYLTPTVWGTGVNSRVKDLTIDAAFAAGADYVQIRTDERNVRSAKAIEKLGAVLQGPVDEGWARRDGSARVSLLYYLTPALWMARRAPAHLAGLEMAS